MTTQTKHTPLPWIAKHDPGESRITPAYGQFRLATLESDGHKSDAAFIIQAVNAHYALVEALREALPYLEYLATNGNPNPDASKTADMAEAALALAEKGME